MSSDNKQPQTLDDSSKENNLSTGPTKRLEPEHFRKVFVGSLSYSTTEESLRKHFEAFGKLVDCVIMKESKTGKSRGFGFVTYQDTRMVDEMMNNRPHRLDGRELETKRATPREESSKPGAEMTTKKLFVGAIREGITEENLKEYFSKYGRIEDCVVMKEKETNKTRGFGFVTFDDYDPVDKIVLEKTHSINGQSLAVKKAMPKEKTVSGNAMSHHSGYARADRSNYNHNDHIMQRERGRFNNNFNEDFNYNQNYNRYDNDYSDTFNSNNQNNFNDPYSNNNLMNNNNNGLRMDPFHIENNHMSTQQIPNNLANFALLAQKMLQNFNAAGVSFPSMPLQQPQQLNRPPLPPINNINMNGPRSDIDRSNQLNGRRGGNGSFRDVPMSQRRPAPYPINTRKPH